MTLDVLISGAGIAGPALAFWLAKLGVRATLLERAPALRATGYAVDVRGAALEVLRRMELRDAVRPYETDTRLNVVVDSRGRRFGQTARGFGVIDEGDVEIHRGDLSRLLYDATQAVADYHFGDSIVELTPAGARVEVTTRRGLRRSYDLVVAADGVHSHTRALAFGPEAGCARPLGSVMAVFTIPNLLGLDREQLLFSATGRVASVKCASQNRELKICVFFHLPPGEALATDDVAAQKEQVSAAFADAGWAFPRLLAAMQASEDFYADITCQIRPERYHEGRVVLLGDAGYCPSPLSGQGTSLALVGAYVLASALGSAGSVDAALTRYDAQMKPFARANQEIALRIASRFAPATPFQVWSRNLSMRMFPYLPGAGLLMKLAMGGVRRASRAIELPAWSPGLALQAAVADVRASATTGAGAP